MSAPTYTVRGPVVAQDGRKVYEVVRPIDGTTRLWPLMECLNAELAQRHADELNHVRDEIERVLIC
jgi:hypothetical protein